MSLLAKVALAITALGLGFGMLTINDRVLTPIGAGPAVSTARFPVQRSDLLVVLPTSIKRLDLVYSSRWWRRGVRTFIVSEELPPDEQDPANIYGETWAEPFRDISAPATKPGDLRAAMAPFLANNTLGINSYKWILYGDDDTVFASDNVINVLGQLDHTQPYLLSDAIWWPENGQGDGKKLHPNREAPRCLPCNYTDPLLKNGTCPHHAGWVAAETCPCTPEAIFQGTWAAGDQGVFDRPLGKFKEGSPVKAGWWYFIHGGAGSIISHGAMLRSSFERVEQYLNDLPWHSGDAMLTETFWNVLGIAPTDPGHGYCRKHVQMMDPGFKGYQAHGPEDVHTGDGGSDPDGMIKRLHDGLNNSACGPECHEQLRHTLSVHVRARYTESNKKAKDLAIVAPWHSACRMIEELSTLFEQYNSKMTSRDPALWKRHKSRMLRPIPITSEKTATYR